MAKDIRIIPASGLIAFSGSNEQSTITVSDDGKIALQGSGSTIFDVQGSQGQLFSVTDSLVGSLFSVNDISGLPILEVFDTDKVVMGTFGQNTLVVTGSNVGIGTTAPGTKLDVIGNFTVSDGTDSGYVYFRRDRSDVYIGENSFFQLTMGAPSGVVIETDSNGNGFSSFNVTRNSSSQFYIADNGNVGIGTTSPANRLTVIQNGSTAGISVSGGTNPQIRATDGTRVTKLQALSDKGVVGTESNNDFAILTNNTEAVRVTASGNVGIGTTDPSSKLEIKSSGSNIDEISLVHSGNTVKIASLGQESSHGSLILRNNGGVIQTRLSAINNSYILAGNVGIGTTSPAAKLEVANNSGIPSTNLLSTFTNEGAQLQINVTSAATGNALVDLLARSGGGGNTPSADFSFSTRNAGTIGERMRITSAGNVGIGVTNPSRKLQVDSAAGYPLSINSTQQYLMEFARNGVSEWWFAVNNGDFKFHENGVGDQVVIKSGGNVGIGTTSPGEKLHVIGTTRSTTFLSPNATGSTGLQITSATTSGNGAVIRLTKDAADRQVYQSFEADQLYLGVPASNTTLAEVGTKSGVDLRFATAYTERMRITSAGNVGIGATAPAFKLQVGTPAVPAGSDYAWSFDLTRVNDTARGFSIGQAAGGTVVLGSHNADMAFGHTFGQDANGLPVFYETMRIQHVDQAAGNVGIGTTSPNYQLTLGGNSVGSTAGLRINDPSNAAYGAHFSFSDTPNEVWIGGITNNVYNSAIGIHREATRAVTVDINNNVGIGTTSPDYKLEVVGDIATITGNIILNSQDIYANREYSGNDGQLRINRFGYLGGTTKFRDTVIFNGKGSTILFVKGSTNNVGIGTTSPGEKLEVVGNIKTSGIVYVGSTASTALTPSADDWIDIAEMAYGEHHGKIAFEWNALSAPSSYHHGWFEIEVGTYYSSAFNYGQDTYVEVTKALAHNDFWLSAVRAVDYGSTVRIQVQVARAVTAGTFRSFVLHQNQGTVSVLTPAINSNSYTVLALANVGEVDSDYVQKAIGNRTRFTKSVAFDDKVGIGTTTPTAALTITSKAQNILIDKGAISFTAATLADIDDHYAFAYNTLRNGSTTGFFITNVGTNIPAIQVKDSSDNAQNLAIQPYGGNVGIGTTSPDNRLHVNGTAQVDNGAINLGGTSSVVGNNPQLRRANSSNDLGIATGGSDRITVLGTGNVGIGTTSPDSFFQVKTHSHYDYVHDLHQKIATFNPSSMSGPGSSAAVNIGNGSYGTSGTENLYLQFLNTHGNFGKPVGWRIKSYTDLDASGANSSFAIQQVRRGNSTSANDGTQPHIDTDFIINQDGNVGIGTTTPLGKFTISSTEGDHIRLERTGQTERFIGISATDALVISNWADLTKGIAIAGATGNVGIGTTSPSYKLDVRGSANNADIGIHIQNTFDDNDANSEPNAVLFFNAASNNGYLRVHGAPANTAAKHQIDLGSTAATSFLTFSPNGAERMRITSAGNVGIGTTAPENKLHVQQADVFTGIHTTAGIRIKSFGASAIDSYHGTIALSRGTGGVAISAVQEASDSDVMGIAFFTHPSATGGDAAVEKMRLDQDGNLGIGTTSPSYKLDVDGTGRFDAIELVNGGGTTTRGLFSDGTLGELTLISPERVTVLFDSNNNDANSFFAVKKDATDPTNATELFRVDSSGNVGIGTTAPTHKLQVEGSADVVNIAGSGSTANTSIFSVDGNNGRLFEVSDDLSDSLFSVNTIAGLPVLEVFADNRIVAGAYNQNDFVISGSRVGIGTDTPTEKLHVYSASPNPTIVGKFENPDGQSIIEIQSKNNALGILQFGDPEDVNPGAIQYDHSGNSMRFKTADAEKMRITSAGNVGIGTTAPLAALHINKIGVPQLLLDGGSDTTGDIVVPSGEILQIGHWNTSLSTYTDRLRIIANGNVGIGNTSPASKLEVTGNVAIGYTSAAPANGMIVAGNVGIGTNSPVSRLHVGAEVSDDNNYSYDANTLVTVHQTPTSTTTLNDPKEVLMLARQGTSGEAYGAAATFDLSRYENAGGSNVGSRTRLDFRLAHDGFLTASTRVMTLRSNGNVGIGTTSPAHKLDVNGTGKFIGVGFGSNGLHSTGANGGNGIYSIAGGSAGSGVYGFTNDISSYGGTFENTTSGFALRVLGKSNFTGNVGIGTTSPSRKLHVSGGILATANGNDGTGTIRLNTGNAHASIVSHQNGTSESEGFTLINGVSTATISEVKIGGYLSEHNAATSISFHTAANNATRAGSQRMLITSAGNVGIGTTSPSFKLDINGELRVGTVVPQTSANFNIRRNGANIEFGHNNRTSGYYGTIGAQGNNGQPYIALSADCDSSLNTFTTRGFKGNVITTDGAGSLMFSQLTSANAAGQSLTERMRITSAGNVGIGTTSPAAKLHIASTVAKISEFERVGSANYDLTISDLGAGAAQLWFNANTNNTGFLFRPKNSSGTNVNALMVDPDGNVGIGTTSPTRKLEVNGDFEATQITVNNEFTLPIVDGNSGQALVTDGAGTVSWGTVGLSASTVDTVATNTNANHYLTFVNSNNGTAAAETVYTTDGIYVNPSTDTLYATGNIVSYATSDRRLKDNLTPIANATEKISKLSGYEFDWNDKQSDFEGHDVGVVAQEVEEVLPEVVTTRKDGYKAVKYEKIVALLIEGMKEQQAEIEALKEEVRKLKG